MTSPVRRLGARLTRGDRYAVLVLLALPAILNLPWAFAGRPLMGGDNLSQNYPLRVLVGELLAHGQLPLWNPDIWSGAALLAGWNAGAMYPGTWLFAVLPGVAAWEVNVILVGAIAGIGMHLFLRSQRCSPLASFLGALVFAYTGFMSGQSVHLGLVEGMAYAPVMLLAIEWMSRKDHLRQMALPVALLGASIGLCVLAGDPRAPSNCGVVALVFVLALAFRSPSKAPRFLAGFLLAIALGVMLSAPQWLPGLAFLHVSQRSVHTLRWYSAGSLAYGQLTYFAVPFIFGGNSTLGLPGFTGNYNLPELTYAAGLLPLVALVVTAFRWLSRRGRQGGTPAGVFVVMFVVGVVLALGAVTPLGHLLARIPLYGGQRLQNRNTAIADVALAALVAIFLDTLRPRAAHAYENGAGLRARWPNLLRRPERLVAILPVLFALLAMGAMFFATAFAESELVTHTIELGLPTKLLPYYAAVACVAVAAAVLTFRPSFRHRLGQRHLGTGIVLADVAIFLVMASYQPAPTAALALRNGPTRALVAAGAGSGRMAIFNPQQVPVRDPQYFLDELGANDLVILRHLESVQGYGSIVSDTYEKLTGAHAVQNLRPYALATGAFDSLDLKVLATLPSLFGSPESTATSAPLPVGPPLPPGRGYLDAEPGGQVNFKPYVPAGPWALGREPVSFELPAPLDIDEISIRLAGPAPSRSGLVLKVVLADSRVVTEPFRPARDDLLVPLNAQSITAGRGAVRIEIEQPGSTRVGPPRAGGPLVEGVAVHALPGSPLMAEMAHGALSERWLALNGILQGLLSPPNWHFASEVGPVTIYTNTGASGSAFLEPSDASGLSSHRAPGSVVSTPVAEWQDPSEVVKAPEGAWLVRSATYDAGWTASALPLGTTKARGQPITLKVRAFGVLEAARLPPGNFVVTWRYGSERAEQGLGLAAVAAFFCICLVAFELFRLRRDRPFRRAAKSRGTAQGKRSAAAELEHR